jgi:hypothetical protein
LFLEFFSDILLKDLTEDIRKNAYRYLLEDSNTINFDFSKGLIFKPLPGKIINQNLCRGQPIFSPELDYFDSLAKFHSGHSCFKCVHKIIFEEYLENDEGSFDGFLHLPEWIDSQMLFENEPVKYPDSVEQFYSYYVMGNIYTSNEEVALNWQHCKRKKEVEDYFLTLAAQYKTQHDEWVEYMSNSKKERFLEFEKLRKSTTEY